MISKVRARVQEDLVYSGDREETLTFNSSDESWFYNEAKDVSVVDLFMEPIRRLFGR